MIISNLWFPENCYEAKLKGDSNEDKCYDNNNLGIWQNQEGETQQNQEESWHL